MRRIHKIVGLVLILLAAQSAWAARITLKDGTVLEGTVIAQSDNYWIRTADGTSRTVSKDDVASYVPDPPHQSVTPATKPSSEPAAAQTLATPEQLKKMLEANQYDQLLKAVTQIMSGRDGGASNYDRHSLWMMRAECYLQQNNAKVASNTLTIAAKESRSEHRPSEAAEADAMGLLIGKSRGNKYYQESGDVGNAIDILNRPARKHAYVALLNDQLVTFDDQFLAAHSGASMDPLIKAADQFTILRSIELAATGGEAKTKPPSVKVVNWANALMTSTMDSYSAELSRISVAATDRAKRYAQLARQRKPKPVEDAGRQQDIISVNQIIGNTAEMTTAIQELNAVMSHPVILEPTATRAADMNFSARRLLVDIENDQDPAADGVPPVIGNQRRGRAANNGGAGVGG